MTPVLSVDTPVLTDERPVLTDERPVLTLLRPVEVEVDRLVTLLFVVLRTGRLKLPTLLLVVLRPVLSEETPVLKLDPRAQRDTTRTHDERPVLTLLNPVEVEVDRLVTLLFVVLSPWRDC